MSERNRSLWKKDAETGQWNFTGNWEPADVPNGIAVFSESAQTKITFDQTIPAEVDTILFDEDAGSFTFIIGNSLNDPLLNISGKGVINNSNCVQSLIVASVGNHYYNPQMKFSNRASAGNEKMFYEAGPTSLEDGYGGGIIGFTDESTAGSAKFTVRTGAQQPPKEGSTVGAEVSFMDHSNGGHGVFTLYGTLGTDGDTFGNVVFHDHSSVHHGMFTNVGGTVSGGDGGNTQLYDEASAAHGTFYNFGASYVVQGSEDGGNGGDVAFDGIATGDYGTFFNLQATGAGSNGGVTSFNNNPPQVDGNGASAGNAVFHNFGAREITDGGGGHTEFTAKHGCPTAGNGTFINYGSILSKGSSAGHTVFYVESDEDNYPTAANGMFWNHAATSPEGSGGYTSFSNYADNNKVNYPSAGQGTFQNMGADFEGAYGGYTKFSQNASADHATLIAFGGRNGGHGGSIKFEDTSLGASATVQLYGNGTLDLGWHTGLITLSTLELTGGIIVAVLGDSNTEIRLSNPVIMHSAGTYFEFKPDSSSFKTNTKYTLLRAPDIDKLDVSMFSGSSVDGIEPTFEIDSDNHEMTVCFYTQD